MTINAPKSLSVAAALHPGVANRQQWVVHHVTENGTVYAREVGDPAKKARRQLALPAEYVGEYAHLSYAATAYGVQGATVDSSHTMLSEASSAAGVYVGMTRGRQTSRLHIVAENLADARAQFVTAMERDPADHRIAEEEAAKVHAQVAAPLADAATADGRA